VLLKVTPIAGMHVLEGKRHALAQKKNCLRLVHVELELPRAARREKVGKSEASGQGVVVRGQFLPAGLERCCLNCGEIAAAFEWKPSKLYVHILAAANPA
jgi:hypothetical protein